MRTRTRNFPVWLTLAVLFLTTIPASAILPPDQGDLAEKSFRRDDLYIRNVPRTVDQMSVVEQIALQSALARLGADASGAFFDVRSGNWGTLVLRQPLIPGTGRLNSLSWADLAIEAPTNEAELKGAVWQSLAAFLAVHQADLGINPAELTAKVTVHEGGRVIQVQAQREIAGVPVRDTFVNAVLNGGNLVLLGTKNWGSIAASPLAGLSSESALDAVAVHLGDHAMAGTRRASQLTFVPLAVGFEPGEAPIGQGIDFALAWAVYPVVAGTQAASWEALVDAHSGEVLAFRDTNQYFDRSMIGGVLPVSNDGLSPNGVPDGTEQPGYPMPFADVRQPFGTSTTTNSSGLVENIGSILNTRLAGPYVRMNDLCGEVDEIAVCGDLDLGIGAGTDCQVPAGHSAGDTRSSRTGFFEVNRIVEQAKSWIPANAWLSEQLTSNMNLDNSCNAFWNGDTINFYTSGVSGSNTCRNTGEIAAVFDHEWGHGMDDNDANGEISRPGEAYADIAALVRLNDSCVARGFFANNSLGGKCTGFGDPCLECSGVRDANWHRRSSQLPHDIAWILRPAVGSPGVPGVVAPGGCVGATAPIPTISDGPCGQSTHCEGNVVSEVVWDLLHRDLRCNGIGWENVPGDGSGAVGGGQCLGAATPSLDVNTTLNAMARVFYEGAGVVNDWYACDATGFTAGCTADGGYMNFLAVDDDNGDLLDGTPHFEAIHAAFARHDMSCQPFGAALSDSGCTTPLPTPVVAGSASEQGATISWTPVAGAGEYWVFRTDGIHGCDFGKERVAVTSGTEHTDAGLLPGREYFYTIEAVGANSSCRSAASVCETVVPNGKPTDIEAVLAFREVANAFEVTTGDMDEYLDNCEDASFRFQVENAGTVDLTNVRLTAVESTSHPMTVVTTALPVALGDLATADCGLQGTAEVAFDFVPLGVGFDEPVVMQFTLEANELTQPLVGTLAFEGTESDFELTATKTFSFESDFEHWRQVSGVYTRENPGANGTLVHLASSKLQSGACDEIQSPEIKLTAASELTLHHNFNTEPGSPTFYDRANVGLFEVATGDRVTVDPDSGQLYNASGSGSVCVTAGQNGWAGVGGGFLSSGWSPTALDAATRAGQRLRLDVAYGTDPLVEGLGFQFDEVTLTNFELQVADSFSDICEPVQNNSPVAIDDSATTDENTAVDVPVLANDSDPDGDPITLDAVTQPSNGMATANLDGTVTHTPNPGFTGTDVFSYEISDDKGATATGIVTVEVGSNTDPVAVDDYATTDEDEAVVIDVVANDSDPDGDPLTVVDVTTPANGVAVDNGNGTVTYTPNPGFFGPDAFMYTISDGRDGEDSATVSVNVRAVGDDSDDDGDSDSDSDDADSDGVPNDEDSDDDNDGDSDTSDSDDDGDGVDDEFDDSDQKDKKSAKKDNLSAGAQATYTMKVDEDTLLLTALIETPGAEAVDVILRDPAGNLIGTAVSTSERSLAAAIPLGGGDYTVTVVNRGMNAVAFDVSLFQRVPWPAIALP